MKEDAIIIIGTIGIDIHSWGMRFIEYALKQEGFKVVTLGVQVSQEEFVDAARETNAAAILVSSLGGHALFDCEGLRERCVEAGLGDILLWIGGNLAVGDVPWEQVEQQLKSLGFDRVYPPSVLPPQIVADLKSDLEARGYRVP